MHITLKRLIRRHRPAGCLAMMLLILFTASGAWIGEATGAEKKIKVEILVFSGHPNPFYFVEEERITSQLKKLIDKASSNEMVKQKTVIPIRLGYNGIVIENADRKSGLPAYIAVYRKNIELKNDQVRFLRDDGALEAFLLKQALEKKVIDAKILDFIQSDQ